MIELLTDNHVLTATTAIVAVGVSLFWVAGAAAVPAIVVGAAVTLLWRELVD